MGRQGVEQALRLEPDLVLMDIRMPVCDGLAATRLIKAQRPEMKIVMLTTSAEDEDLFEAIKSGACGYLLKSIKGPAFVEALHGLEEGAPPFSPGLATRLLREFGRRSGGENPDGVGSEEPARSAGFTRPPDRAADRGAAARRIRADVQRGGREAGAERSHGALPHERDHEPAAPGEPQPGDRLRGQARVCGINRNSPTSSRLAQALVCGRTAD